MPLSNHAGSCSAIRQNYQSQPQLMGFTYIGHQASLPINCTLDENIGGHIYTVTNTLICIQCSLAHKIENKTVVNIKRGSVFINHMKSNHCCISSFQFSFKFKHTYIKTNVVLVLDTCRPQNKICISTISSYGVPSLVKIES